MSKAPYKPVRVKVPIYGQSVYFYSQAAALPKQLIEGSDECGGFSCLMDHGGGNSYHVVYVGESPDLTEIVAMQVLVHELVHTAMHILGYAGVEVDTENHEALTYLTDYLMGEALRKWAKIVPPEPKE
jgi:hypothetical protein